MAPSALLQMQTLVSHFSPLYGQGVYVQGDSVYMITKLRSCSISVPGGGFSRRHSTPANTDLHRVMDISTHMLGHDSSAPSSQLGHLWSWDPYLPTNFSLTQPLSNKLTSPPPSAQSLHIQQLNSQAPQGDGSRCHYVGLIPRPGSPVTFVQTEPHRLYANGRYEYIQRFVSLNASHSPGARLDAAVEYEDHQTTADKLEAMAQLCDELHRENQAQAEEIAKLARDKAELTKEIAKKSQKLAALAQEFAQLI
ncbi:hypothetical protein BDP55DRAFT_713715 [Colletotrichum godetiae]|uniref:Uncharacterized protein n=1 Tax=Colletotrichum godetiae TaxID=1209918 RepID=A0AAJ0AS14_9PEZI|nr:uncharacterized protein BDP55DRAFT_713715 [Colletotrichum godetiae]KAK1687886.1 hypothetical protein BDP55DRAFT_713715 [Colletotrichum godetiae]